MKDQTLGMKEFGALIGKLVRREDLSTEESEKAFLSLLADEQTPMQQGAFLSALTAKGETIEEMTACWKAIYHVDTIKPEALRGLTLMDNSGTGMDTFKTFNISTAAAIIAAAGGLKMGKHGSRAITSSCGTIDLLEILGVGVEDSPELAVESIMKTGIGIFNGTSSMVHPKALGRILSQIAFGTTLNISASLANPALPKWGLRGVYRQDMLEPVAKLMKSIGYEKIMVVYGQVDGSELGMDEASICGTTQICSVHEDGSIQRTTLRPEELGLKKARPEEIMPMNDRTQEAMRILRILKGSDQEGARDAVCLNSGLLFYVAGSAKTIQEGVAMAGALIDSGAAYEKLVSWVRHQSMEGKGLKQLLSLERNVG
ncbi:anthranilate phosphoribosyltransferase [Alkalibacter rhizosphaerae]|uniref:Anthranilate phosphoribosyltransferase n=2 Tax=Alkalibacter rhizosphaerae TaxID=2815577 RepID=A0A974XJ03_9FIRM|nr:anthranilate phosphoribosyltransferase [Alkalibacter rhizosphaerae]